MLACAGVSALPDSFHRVNPHRITTLQNKDQESALPPFSIVLSQDETSVNHRFLQSRLHFLKTTKETQTKELNQPLSSLLSSASTSQAKDEKYSAGESEGSKGWEEETRRFLDLFERAYRGARPDDLAAPPEKTDLALLHNYFGRGHEQKLETWLPALFNCSHGFVRRRHYSLHSYLRCCFILQVHAGALNIKSM